MSEDGQGLGAGNILAGMVLILFGLCLFTIGGGCTALWVAMIFSSSFNTSGLGMLVLSVATAAAGIAAIVGGVKIWRGPRRGD